VGQVARFAPGGCLSSINPVCPDCRTPDLPGCLAGHQSRLLQSATMKIAVTILACLAWLGSGSAVQTMTTMTAESGKVCCSCCQVGRCECGCSPDAASQDVPKPPIRLLCCCDDLPAIQWGGFRSFAAEPPSLAAVEEVNTLGGHLLDFPKYARIASDCAPSGLSHLRTIILLN
jgi:hypothetical protein